MKTKLQSKTYKNYVNHEWVTSKKTREIINRTNEIATILGKPPGAVKALQRRALGALKRDERLTVVSP